MDRFEKVLGVCNYVLGALKFVVFCTSPRFTESTTTGRNLIYLIKTINVYNLYVETDFRVDAGPLHSLLSYQKG